MTLVASVALLACLLATGGCGQGLEPPDDQLLGVWTTDAARYQGRFFEVRPDAIVFGTGAYSPARLHRLIGVAPAPSKASDGQGFRLRYREDDGALVDVEVFVRSGVQAQLRFANREEVWRRANAAGGERIDG